VTPAILHTWRRWFGKLLALVLAAAILWLGGLVWFALRLPDRVEDPATATDAIIVLTGGSQRIAAGIELLAAGKAKKLFISGVHPGVGVEQLLEATQRPADWTTCCIVLGHAADNTLGNAAESAAWMHAEGFRSARLVTASYHMPRSLLEFARAMPAVTFIPHPVFPERVHQAKWWLSPGTLWLILGEYDKYLAAWARAALPAKLQ
jgi:uncharacterized SAM-binding protein YcdF (DUF218 family)